MTCLEGGGVGFRTDLETPEEPPLATTSYSTSLIGNGPLTGRPCRASVLSGFTLSRAMNLYFPSPFISLGCGSGGQGLPAAQNPLRGLVQGRCLVNVGHCETPLCLSPSKPDPGEWIWTGTCKPSTV